MIWVYKGNQAIRKVPLEFPSEVVPFGIQKGFSTA